MVLTHESGNESSSSVVLQVHDDERSRCEARMEHNVAKESHVSFEDVEEAADEAFRGVCFAEVEPDDVPAMRHLYEDSFPVTYDNKFYKDLGSKVYSGVPLITQVARCSLGGDMEVEESVAGAVEAEMAADVKERYMLGDEKVLLGSIVAQIRKIGDNVDGQPSLSARSISKGYCHGCYILTLATHKNCRRKGVGSKLVGAVERAAKNDPTCGVIYLHVITYNKEAISFYERHGYKRLRSVQRFYKIKGEYFDSYLYGKYLGDATPGSREKTFWETLVDTVSSIFGGMFSFNWT